MDDYSKLFMPKKLLSVRKRDTRQSPLRIQNIVCTAWAGMNNLPLTLIAESLHGRLAEKLFPAVISKCMELNTTNICFSTGQVLITGAKTVEFGYLSAHLFIDRIHRDLQLDVGVYNFSTVNVVGSFSLGFHLSLDLFYHRHRAHAQWGEWACCARTPAPTYLLLTPTLVAKPHHPRPRDIQRTTIQPCSPWHREGGVCDVRQR